MTSIYALLLLVVLFSINVASAISSAPLVFNYARCQKNGVDWAYLTTDICTNFGASGKACNGPCLTINGRYCTYTPQSGKGDRALCRFKNWCEQDGYTALVSKCIDGVGFPISCTPEHRIFVPYAHYPDLCR
ncbi:MAG: hypothetical protein J3R72DRAFT_444674 [Linnemannia gamsii]|nr:MAG: hypothetical protein J3R72DRAFT_444673 [Linnemannia gamsii]KAK3841663.1 MAG: hypothetical protein J3R72DRAFT_444674 [Linnemannia gamsii]